MSGDALNYAGQICNYVRTPSPNEDVAAHEGEGPFIFADVRDVGNWTGLERRGRWKVRVLGPLADLPMVWNHVRPYLFHKDLPAAQAHFQAIKKNLEQTLPGTQFRPHPTFGGGSVPGGRVEVIVGQQGNNAGVLMLDGVHDYDVARDMTPGLGAIPAGNEDGPRVVSWQPPACAPFLAWAPGSGGAADHVVALFSPGQTDVRTLIRKGLPGMARDPQTRDVTIDVPSGVLVGFWSRLDGQRLIAGARGTDPAAWLASSLGQSMTAPLDVGDPELAPRLAGPSAFAVRVQPGTWRAQLWMGDTDDGAGVSAVVLSRQGAGSFQLMQGGGAQGKKIAGLTLERYAELSAARDRLTMKAAGGGGMKAVGAALGAMAGGAHQQELDALCDKFGVPRGPWGLGGRVPEWDQAIAASPALTAEFTAFMAIANARLDGIDPNTLDLAGIRARAVATQEAVSAQATAHADSTTRTLEGHYAVFEAARTRDSDALLAWAKTEAYAHLKGDDIGWAFGRANAHLHLYEDDACRVQGVRQVLKSFLEACWKAQPPGDREGSLAGFVREQSREIEEAYGIGKPSLLDRL
jgi:hypothetical protein